VVLANGSGAMEAHCLRSRARSRGNACLLLDRAGVFSFPFESFRPRPMLTFHHLLFWFSSPFVGTLRVLALGLFSLSAEEPVFVTLPRTPWPQPTFSSAARDFFFLTTTMDASSSSTQWST
jgi:hypothetical protein